MLLDILLLWVLFSGLGLGLWILAGKVESGDVADA